MYIYIHIPFCNNICKYCDFPKMLYDKKFVNKYLDSLKNEIKTRYKSEIVKTIFIGGGTPTSLDYNELKKLLDITKIFNRNDSIEFTIESNVENLDQEKIKLLKEYGVNRVSLGVQSFNDDILKELNRIHNVKQVFEVIKNLKKEGITNISIDYIYGVNDNIDIVKDDINTFLNLNIPHISCYSLIIENNTVFGINKREYIDELKEYKMYKYIEKKLKENDYIHYEISNYSKNNYFSIHNLNYWNNGFYYGFGLGSVSYIDNYRINNTKNLRKYFNHEYVEDSIYEDLKTEISNTIILGLRKINGINIEEFNRKFNVNILTLYNIEELIKEKKLIIENKCLKISEKYFYISNEILLNFL